MFHSPWADAAWINAKGLLPNRANTSGDTTRQCVETRFPPSVRRRPADIVREMQCAAAGQRMEIIAFGVGAQQENGVVRWAPNGQFAHVGFAHAGALRHDLIARGAIGVQCGENGLLDGLHIYTFTSTFRGWTRCGRTPGRFCSAIDWAKSATMRVNSSI